MASKDGRFYLRLTHDERAMFDKVAEAIGAETASHAVRFVMRQKYRDLFGELPKGKPLPKPRRKPKT
ncbi:MAG TPA: hypothetical protein VGJ84_17290 [Polyangiaceae bacterium]